MNRHFVRGAWMLISFCLALLLLSPGIAENAGQGETSTDVLKALGFSSVLHDEAAPKHRVSRSGGVETILGGYTDVSLPELLKLAGKLEEERWYLTGDKALKDRRTLLVRYDMKTRCLLLELALDAAKNVWPDVLTPQLSCTTPAFTRGTFRSSAPKEIPNRVDCVQLIYENTTPKDVLAYTDLLVSSGYAPQNAKDAGTEYARSLTFIRLLYHEQKEQLDITVGQYLVFYVPLPPWPDPLPEQLKRVLPTVSAKQNIDKVTSGYLAGVTDMPLFALCKFVNTAHQHYGWSALDDDAVMTHQEMNIRLEFLTFSTDTHRALFLIEGDGSILFFPTPTM